MWTKLNLKGRPKWLCRFSLLPEGGPKINIISRVKATFGLININ